MSALFPPAIQVGRSPLAWLFALLPCLLFAGQGVVGQSSSAIGNSASKLVAKPAINPSLTIEKFPAVDARYLRFTVLKSNSHHVGIDELEVFTAESESRNVAAVSNGALFSNSESTSFQGEHPSSLAGDGLFGYKNSWYARGGVGVWIQVKFVKLERIERVVWSRDRTGERWGGTPTEYAIEVSADSENWTRIASSQERAPGLRRDLVAIPPFEKSMTIQPGSHRSDPVNSYFNVDEFAPVEARYIRFSLLISHDASASLDEVEVYSPDAADVNLALASSGAVASSSNPEDGPSDRYRASRINDGIYGDEACWRVRGSVPAWVQIELPEVSWIHQVVWSQDRKEKWFDRTPFGYRIEVAEELGEWTEVSSSETRQKSNLLMHTKEEFTLDEYLVDSWSEEDGLPLNSIYDFAQTSDGYLWLGTENGLLRFDGHEFTLLNRQSTSVLSTSRVSKVYVDRSGRLWFTNRNFFYESSDNLVVYERGDFRRVNLRAGYIVSDFFEERGGELWVLTQKGALPWRDGRLDYDGLLGGFTAVHRRDIPEGPGAEERKRWDGVPGKWLHGEFVPFYGFDGHPLVLEGSDNADGQLSRRDGGGWILQGGLRGNRDFGPNRILRLFADGTTSAPRPLPWTDATFRARACLSDSSNRLWIAAEGLGLFCLLEDGERFQSFAGFEDLEGVLIRRLFEDSAGNIWIATADSGLKRLRKRLFRSIGTEQGMLSRFKSVSMGNSYSVTPASDGGVWIGTHSSGAYRWDDRKLSWLLNSFIFSWAVMEDSRGVVWSGAYGRGTRRHFEDQLQILPGVSDHTFSFLEDRSGRVWSGGDFGVTFFDDNMLHRRVPPSFSEGRFEWVISMAEDSEGGIWMGTKLGFLHRYIDDAFEIHWASEKGSEYPVCALHFDASGALWVARFGFGLSRFQNGNVDHFTPSEGLPTVSVNGILDDQKGFLWMTSKEGVFRISYENFDRFVQGESSPFLWHRFTERDGLPSKVCQGEQNQPGLCQTTDGRIWIPTLNGVGVMDPKTLEATSSVPPVMIQDVTLYGEDHRSEVLISDGELTPDANQERFSLTIPPGNHNLMIRYTFVDFVAPGQVNFRYRLLGSDEGWIDAKNGRSALIASLRAGSYQFEVMAIDHLGRIGETATFRLIVEPFWWETGWFLTLISGALLVGCFGGYAARVKQLKRRSELQSDFSRQLIEREESERKRISQELHDSLGHELLLVRNRALDGANVADSIALKDRFEDISELAGQALENTRGMAYNLRPFELDRIGFQRAVETMIGKISESSQTRYFRDIDDLEGVVSASSIVYLYRLVQEGLNNILKHSQATVVMLEIKREGGFVRVQLDDNGVGFDPERVHGGLGLNGMRERVKLIGGRLEFKTAPGEGTRIRIQIPISLPL